MLVGVLRFDRKACGHDPVGPPVGGLLNEVRIATVRQSLPDRRQVYNEQPHFLRHAAQLGEHVVEAFRFDMLQHITTHDYRMRCWRRIEPFDAGVVVRDLIGRAQTARQRGLAATEVQHGLAPQSASERTLGAQVFPDVP